MQNDPEIVETSRFFLELTALGDSDNDLDSLLVRLFSMLNKLPSFRFQQKGVIRMYSPGRQLVTVAQHGYPPVWLEPATDALFAGVGASDDKVFVAGLMSGEQAFVLPIANGSRPLGQVIILTAADWTPDDAKVEFMTNLGRALSSLVSRCLMNETLQLREIELEDARTQVIRRLSAASEFRDNETGLHIIRMSNIAVVIAKALGLPAKQRELLFVTAPMHDVGKLGIADAIMLKPGKLTSEEFDIMKTHTEIGERLLQGSDALVEAARDIAVTHHENWDGSGYPRGMRGEEISILARICAIADVFDALTSARAYKQAWPVEMAVSWIRGETGKKFDPAVVAAFDEALPEILRIMELYREEVINPNQCLKLPELPYCDTQWVSWDASLSVGIDVIDEHHRYLFDLTNDLINVMVNKRGVRELMRMFGALTEYAQVHFRAEERMMEHYCFEGTDRQKKQHREFEKNLKVFATDLHDNLLIAQIEVVSYLRGWLVAHIRDEDTRLSVLVTD